MLCEENDGKKTSTLPPPCRHCRPPRFHCPTSGCPPPEPCPPQWPSCPEPCQPLRCRQPPGKPVPPPTLCIAKPCPEPSGIKPPCFPQPPKMKPPKTSVRFCIQNTCEGSTYCPCYEAEMPCCSSKLCKE
ncbi:small proline-rich protein 2H-like [Diprion similis]|uniref:small proline-rich protein 2H-like n=1 Tax=Diprion similis TaxID=362088 RepID=UPI001EF7D16A|nr:small proline-rich protein 2H-like [Diprion similis]